jgi:hypothetical protein
LIGLGVPVVEKEYLRLVETSYWVWGNSGKLAWKGITKIHTHYDESWKEHLWYNNEIKKEQNVL